MKLKPLSFLSLALLSAASLRAARPGPLPDFQVTGRNGRQVPSAELGSSAPWLLIYMSLDCGVCADLWSLLEAEQNRLPGGRVVLVLQGSEARAGVMIKQHPRLRQYDFYFDAQQDAWTKLALTGQPVILGIRDGQIAWSMSGLVGETANWRTALQSWVNTPAPVTSTSPSATALRHRPSKPVSSRPAPAAASPQPATASPQH